MKSDVQAYWDEKRKEAKFIDIHLPEFQSKDEVDKYIEDGNQLLENIIKNKNVALDDNDDF